MHNKNVHAYKNYVEDISMSRLHIMVIKIYTMIYKGVKLQILMYTCIIFTEQKKTSIIKYVFWIILDHGAHSITSRYVHR